jgi:fucose 4-O-acetylase-like acetyltransferase
MVLQRVRYSHNTVCPARLVKGAESGAAPNTILHPRRKPRADWRLIAVIAACGVVGYAIPVLAPGLRSPLNVAVVPIAVVPFWFGHLLREIETRRLALWVFAAGAIVVCVLALSNGMAFELNMRSMMYRPPFLELVLALALSWVAIEGAKCITRVPVAARFWAVVGRASLVIFMLHQFIALTMRKYGCNSYMLTLVAAIGISILFYSVVDRIAFFRKCFLGRARTIVYD